VALRDAVATVEVDIKTIDYYRLMDVADLVCVDLTPSVSRASCPATLSVKMDFCSAPLAFT
jgi:hypothetical protein